MAYLEGEQHSFQLKSDRDKLVGYKIKYLRHRDIDRSGRGYFFPQFDYVVSSDGLNLELDCGDYLRRGEIAEIVRLGKIDG